MVVRRTRRKIKRKTPRTYTVTARRIGRKTPYSKGTGLTYAQARKIKKIWSNEGSKVTIKKSR